MNKTTKTSIERKYRFIKQLGQDWFGEIHEVKPTIGGRPVVLRIMHPHLASEGQLADKLFRDIKAASKIIHPNLGKIIYVNKSEDGIVFFTREYLKGETLRSKLEREKTVSVEEASRTTLQILSALHSVHKKGLTHGYLRPECIFLSETEQNKIVIKLVDYSIIDIQDLVQYSGVVKNYMSPEQALGEGPVDVRTDIFATGSMLYEMLSGRRAYEAGENEDVSLKIVLKSPPSLGRIAPDLPADLIAIVEKAMENDYDQRCADVVELIKDIVAFDKQFAESMSSVCVRALKRLLPPDTFNNLKIAPKAPNKKMPLGKTQLLGVETKSKKRPATKTQTLLKPEKKYATVLGHAVPKRLQNLNAVFDDQQSEPVPPSFPDKKDEPLGKSDILTQEIVLPVLGGDKASRNAALAEQGDPPNAPTAHEPIPPPLSSKIDSERESTTVNIDGGELESIGQSLLYLEDDNPAEDDVPDLEIYGSPGRRATIKIQTALSALFDALARYSTSFRNAALPFIVKLYSGCRQLYNKKSVILNLVKGRLASRKNQYIAMSGAAAMILFLIFLLAIFNDDKSNSLDNQNLKRPEKIHLESIKAFSRQDTDKQSAGLPTKSAALEPQNQENSRQPKLGVVDDNDRQKEAQRVKNQAQDEDPVDDDLLAGVPTVNESKDEKPDHGSTEKQRKKLRRKKSKRRRDLYALSA